MDRKYDTLIFAFIALIMAALLHFLTELAFRGDAALIGQYLQSGMPLLLSYGITLAVCLLFVALTGHIVVGFGVSSIIFVVLVFVNAIKYASLATVFVPQDLFRAGLAARFGGDVAFAPDATFWLFLVVWAIALFTVYMLLPDIHINIPVRIILLGLSGAYLAFMLTATDFKLTFLSNSHIKYDMLDPDYTYAYNGLTLGFALHARSTLTPKPPQYDVFADTYASVAADVEPNPDAPLVNPTNIIFYLSESFWDAHRMPKLRTGNDPLKNYRLLASRFPSGELIVPSFGGATINTEFEVLTGLSTSFLPRGTYPFLQYMTRDLTSIASFLRDDGWRTVGVHTYDREFYSRNLVYPMLGFNEWYGVEDMMRYDVSGGYLSDTLLADTIADLLTGNDADSVKLPPRKKNYAGQMIFAISMENHLPYSSNKYEDDVVNILNDDLAATEHSTLTGYLNGTARADAALKYLTQRLSEIPERTLLVFFGDHLPPFDGQTVYTKLGMLDTPTAFDWTAQQRYNLHATPLLIWANYPIGLPSQKLSIGSSFLSSYVLRHYTTYQDSDYFNVIGEVNRDMRAVNGQVVVDANGNAYTVAPDELANSLDLYNGMTYNALFDGGGVVSP